jgi:hypothetical protein
MEVVMVLVDQETRAMTMEEIAATMLLATDEIGNGWLIGCGRDCGYLVGHCVSEDKARTYWFSIDPVAMVLDELEVVDD